MRRALHRFGAGFVGGLLATMMAGSGMVALADEVLEDAEMADEAWFFRYRDVLEPVPPGLGIDEAHEATEIPRATVRDATNPYGTETVHVGVLGGDEESVTFLGLPTLEIGFSAQITGGEVRLPISGMSGPQARNPESADMVACLAPDMVIEVHGGTWESMYDYDCGTRAEVVLEEGSDPLTWTIDLAPFAAVWGPGDDAGIAILPNPDSDLSPPEQNWHVSFQNKHYEPETPADPEKNPITVTLTYTEEEFPEIGDVAPVDEAVAAPPPPSGTTGSPGFAPAAPSRSSPPAAATGFAPPAPDPPPEAAEGEPAPGEAAPVEEAVAAEAAEPVGIRVNPLVYLLPFLAVGLAGLLGYSLTQQPVLPHAREGAVSALMRKRRLAAATTPSA